MSKHFVLLAVLALGLSGCNSVQTENSPPFHYAAFKEVHIEKFLPPPPVAGSHEDKRDMRSVMAAQTKRTTQQANSAQRDVVLSVFAFDTVLGPDFTSEKLPLTARFFQNLAEDEKHSVRAAKDYYARPRPYTASVQVKPVVEHPHNASYPSGHTAFAYLNAIFLSQMLPEKKNEIFARAWDYSNNRLIAGVHYPTDLQAGVISAVVIAQGVMQDPKLQRDFEAAKHELRSALAKSGA